MKCKIFNTFLFFSLLFVTTQAQIQNPVHWSFSVNQKNSTEAELIFKANIDKNWHLYSQFLQSDQGPIATTFTFQPNKNYQLLGKVLEGKFREEYDKNFEMTVRWFEGEAIFIQKIKILSTEIFSVKGTLTYQACDNEKCLPPQDVEYNFVINSGVQMQNAMSFSKTDSLLGLVKDTVADAAIIPFEIKLEPDCGELTGVDFSGISPWIAFWEGIIAGFLALLTPCVFAMIPLTVSFFIKQSKDRKTGIRNAWIYAISIVVIYVIPGFLLTKFFGSDTLNAMASNVWFNMIFFIIFIVFAVSFFGAFEITLPSSWVNTADSMGRKKGIIGIFFMAFTLTLVSFSCTMPIIGTLLAIAAKTGNNTSLLLGMTGFAVALALPFALIAVFPAWLQSLPKSGSWLNVLKVSLGFIELALALKFLSNADLAYHWGILKREIFIALWIIIFGLWGFYLLGKIRLPNDSETHHISIGRLTLSIIVLSFSLYMIPGLWGSPLRIISGFPPPDFYKEWISEKTSSCPHNLNCFHNYDEGMRYAKQAGKPVMLDFTGWSCVNCRKMEDNVWSHPEVLQRLSDKYVLISLYVDDKEGLPENECISKYSGKKIKNIGNKWSDFQASVYGTNSQPYYVLIDNNGKILAHPRGYVPDYKMFRQFLDEGICRYEKRKQ
ncbi:MAG: cytochrome c biogenesis protein CcdA [Bacteroidota bacterium]